VINPSLWYQCMYPTGILCLASYLDLHGFPSTIIDSRPHPRKIPHGKREESILDRVREMQPKVVCLSCTHMEFDEVVRLNSAIRKMDGNTVTIVGGSQPTYRTSDFMDNGFDFVCVGEGEKTLLRFIEETLNGGHQWQAIDGLVWKQGGDVVSNPPRTLMTESELQFDLVSAYGKIDERYFDFGVEIIRGLPLAGALLLTTRGCPYNCSFCGCNSIFGRKIRHRSIECIEREVRYLTTEKHVEGIWILDDTFTVNKNHAIAVAKILDMYHVIWGCQSRVDSLTPAFIAELKKLGCLQMDFGVESGSQRILDEVIGKKTNIEQVIRSFDLTKKHRIRTLANFIIGLPTETDEDLDATKRLADRIKADIYVFSIAIPLPGTRLYDMVGENIRPQDYSSLNWNGSLLTEKLNKSTIKNIVQERRSLKLKYLLKSITKSIFSSQGFLFILVRKHRIKRINTSVRFLIRTVLGT
jgi:anaerobic magnesium-protoporphyrin IX monomethyl ester cyclase